MLVNIAKRPMDAMGLDTFFYYPTTPEWLRRVHALSLYGTLW